MAKKDQLTTSDYLEYSEYERLLKELRKDKEYKWELFARLSFCTACRASDVLALTWGKILGKSKAIITEQKTGKSRIITFNDLVQGKITELYHLMGSPSETEKIFKGRNKDNQTALQYVNRRLKDFKFQYKIKIDNFSTHTFRKTFGRYVYEKNNKSLESLVLLNKIFKHSNINITETYIGVTQDNINDIYNSIEF